MNCSRTCVVTSGVRDEACGGDPPPILSQPKSIEFKLPALTARAWVGAENGSLSDGPPATPKEEICRRSTGSKTRQFSHAIILESGPFQAPVSYPSQVGIEQVMGTWIGDYPRARPPRLTNQDANLLRHHDCVVPGRNGPGLYGPGEWGPGQWG
jgi:hypothetical protein